MSALDLRAAALPELEGVIERGLATYVEVGSALAEIRDRRLYRETYDDFDTYCRRRWGWARRYVDYQIEAAQVVASLPPGTIVRNEAQARELARVEPERRAEVMAAASVDGPPTAARIREIGVRTGRAPDGTRERVTGTDPRIGEKALERIADGLRWVRHAGGPTVLVDAALQSSASSLLVEGWLHDVQRHIAALEEWRAALLATKNLRRVK